MYNAKNTLNQRSRKERQGSKVTLHKGKFDPHRKKEEKCSFDTNRTNEALRSITDS